jgi:nitrogen fixation/metabolism regulation signal transduction histidine kinase
MPVMVDRSQLIQVIHNLIQNAQDAVGEEATAEIIVQLGERVSSRGDKLIRLTVLDNGPGISPEMKARLFEPYFTSKARGNGLGLAIVKKIVEENHGKVVLGTRHELITDGSTGAIALVEFAKLENEADNRRVNSNLLSLHRSSPNG